MVVDSSAVAAILFGEEGSEALLARLASPGRRLMSALTLLETSIVVEARKGEVGSRSLARLIAAAEVEVVAFDSGQAAVALDAWRRYGKGRHPAGLNLGDCASYALATVAREELLFKGEDFALTDIAPAP